MGEPTTKRMCTVENMNKKVERENEGEENSNEKCTTCSGQQIIKCNKCMENYCAKCALPEPITIVMETGNQGKNEETILWQCKPCKDLQADIVERKNTREKKNEELKEKTITIKNKEEEIKKKDGK